MQSTAAHTTRCFKKGVLRAVLLLGSLAHLVSMLGDFLHQNEHEAGQFWIIYIIEGSLEVKLPTIWTDEKQSREEAERRERLEERRVEEKGYKKKEDPDA